MAYFPHSAQWTDLHNALVAGLLSTVTVFKAKETGKEYLIDFSGRRHWIFSFHTPENIPNVEFLLGKGTEDKVQKSGPTFYRNRSL